MRKFLAALAATALTVSAAPALAQSTDALNDQDLACVAIFAAIGGVVTPGSQEANAAGMGMTYYLGRLQGRTPGVDWLQEMYNRRETLFEPAYLESHFTRCGEEFSAQGRRMIEVGDILSAAGA